MTIQLLRCRRCVLLVLTLLVAALTWVADRTPASASQYYCVDRATSYHWAQESCLSYEAQNTWPYGEGLYGNGVVYLATGFNRLAVSKCRAYLQLKSSYGSLTEPLGYDCYTEVRRGGTYYFPEDDTGIQFWGLGRRSGDVYTQYAWMEVWTVNGGHYDGRSTAAQVSVTKP